ncbi:TPA: hypothetical protein ACSP7Y_005369 [Serratia fonticola]
MRILLIILLMAVAQSTFSRPLSTDELQAVESFIREDMKDPDSAKFYHGEFPYPQKTAIYCGLVNGKNSFGGYVGKTLFSVLIFDGADNKIDIVSLAHDSEGKLQTPEALSALCAGGGYNLPVMKVYENAVNKARERYGIPPIDKDLIVN